MSTLSDYLSAVADRAQKATPGAWIVTDDRRTTGPIVRDEETDTPISECFDNVDDGLEPIGNEQSDRNIAFIAAARSDVPKLLRIIAHQAETIEYVAGYFKGLPDQRWARYMAKRQHELEAMP